MLESLKKEPIEDKVNQLFDIIESMMKLFLRTIDMVESSINKIELKFDGHIKQLESKIESPKVKGIKKGETEGSLAQLKPPSIVQVPKAPATLVDGHTTIRGAIMGELKELLKNRRAE